MEDRHHEGSNRRGSHKLSVDERERTSITGVINVESFDDREIVLETELGVLTLRGEDLHINRLDLEEGEFAVDGLVWSLQYSAIGDKGLRGKGKGLFDRLFR